MRCHAQVAALALASLLLCQTAAAQSVPAGNGGELVQLDFADVELSVVIDTIARLTGTNFIYDDRVRGRVTIVSPTAVTVDQAYAVFESVLQVKGFTVLEGPGGVRKIIPVRDAKESSIETIKDRRPSPNRDKFVTRLIPLEYIDAEAITNTVKPLVSKDAAMVAYAPTNTIILTDTSANIGRLLSILEAIDVETYNEDLAVIKVQYADATTMSEQIAEIFGVDTSGAAAAARRRTVRRRTPAAATQSTEELELGKIRIITDERTNSLIVLASRSAMEEVRGLVRKLDVPIVGGGRIHVYYLRHADSEELSQTLNALLSGQSGAATPGRTGAAAAAQAQALRSAITELAEGITITADPATNALVIQASKEAYETLREVIEKLDIPRPQVLVEALIMEVTVSDGENLGFSGALRLINGDTDLIFRTATDAALSSMAPGLSADVLGNAFGSAFTRDSRDETDADGNPTGNGSVIQAIIRASASDSDTNVISAPHILTSDNEEAEIRIGDNIPIISSRVQSAAGQESNLSTSVNVERQDIGVTLRVTPQISEGDTLRLNIFQEITNIGDQSKQESVGNAENVGVALTNRRIENTVVVADGETVVIGGLLSDDYMDSVDKVPFLGDIPILGWAFKTTSRNLLKRNLLVFLTPHIVRTRDDLELQTIRKRKEFAQHAEEFDLDESYEEGKEPERSDRYNPVRERLREHTGRYPLERMRELEVALAERKLRTENLAGVGEPRYGLRAAVFSDEDAAAAKLAELYDAGYDATLVSSETDGTLIFEIRMGPYDTLDEAKTVAIVLQRAYDLDSTVTVLPPEGEQPVEPQ